jgi:hypothetical protein
MRRLRCGFAALLQGSVAATRGVSSLHTGGPSIFDEGGHAVL